MTDNEFFRFIQEEWYCEFVGAEVPKSVSGITVHDEFFLLEDVPF